MGIQKIAVLGHGGVGKTCLIKQFVTGRFVLTHHPTIEDSYRHLINLPDGSSQIIEIIDMAGSMHFPAMRRVGIESAQCFMVVYSRDSQNSLESAREILDEIYEVKSGRAPVVVVANKRDIDPVGDSSKYNECNFGESKKEVDDDTASVTCNKKFHKTNSSDSEYRRILLEIGRQDSSRKLSKNEEKLLESCKFHQMCSLRETSAMSNENVEQVFQELAAKLYFLNQVEDSKGRTAPSGSNTRVRINRRFSDIPLDRSNNSTPYRRTTYNLPPTKREKKNFVSNLLSKRHNEDDKSCRLM